jgi:hypothetical protein
MKVLIVSQYFWPENFKINDVAKGLVERGYEVSVLTGTPNYPLGKFHKGYSFFKKRTEKWNGITIYRSTVIPRGKGSGVRLFLNYFSLAFFASIRVLFIKNKFDRIFVYEASPVTIGIPAIIAKYRFENDFYALPVEYFLFKKVMPYMQMFRWTSLSCQNGGQAKYSETM